MLKIILCMLVAALKSRRQLSLDNLALRHRLEILQRNTKRPHLRPSDRALWALLSRTLPDWRRLLSIVQPATVVRWHRADWRLYWRWRSNPDRGRPKVAAEIRTLIRQMSLYNPLCGMPRIHGELLKLGYDVSKTTIAKYMVRKPGPPSQTWRTFIHNHLAELVAIDFFAIPTVTFRSLYVFLVLSLDRRRIIYFNVTANPTASWTSLQLIQAFPFDSAPRFLIRDRDAIFDQRVMATLKILSIDQVVTAPRSPWQNGYCERVIGAIRRECLDHVIVLGDRHLRRVLKKYLAYYHGSRTHLGLGKDTPVGRPVPGADVRPVIAEPILGGLHHRYYREAA